MRNLNWPYGRIFGSDLLPRWAVRAVLAGSLAAAGVFCAGVPVRAAERVMVRIGSFEQSFAVADLERFAETGEISSDLKPFALVLNADVRRVLKDRLELDPEGANKLIDDLLKSPNGQRLAKAVDLAFPGTNIELVRAAMMLAAQQANGVGVIAVVRALPVKTLNVDLSALIAAVSTIKLPPLGSKVQESSSLPEESPVSDALHPAAGFRLVPQ
jgi:hypothetical protein